VGDGRPGKVTLMLLGLFHTTRCWFAGNCAYLLGNDVFFNGLRIMRLEIPGGCAGLSTFMW